MGRRSDAQPDDGEPVILTRLQVDQGGYDAGGAYWGVGEPLWSWQGETSGATGFFRAADRTAALVVLADLAPDSMVKSPEIADLDQFVDAYCEALLFFSSDTNEEGTESTPLDHEHTMADIDTENMECIRQQCEAFVAVAGEAISGNPGQAGQDFFLTRNGHGSGFWDRPEVWGGDEMAERLSALARAFGEQDVVAEDGTVFVEGGGCPERDVLERAFGREDASPAL
jgi:hypothetical protein